MTRPSPSRQPAIQAPSALRTLPSAFTATTAHAVSSPRRNPQIPSPAFMARSPPRSLPTDAPHPAPTLPSASGSAAGPCANTTIGVVLTNARLTKAQATKASSTVHDAYARAIKPVHTSGDGDTVFTFASGEVEADYDTFAILATEAMQGAVVRAVEQAEGAYGLPAARDLVSC